MFSAFLQVFSFLYFGISFGACQERFRSHVLVYQRQKYNIFNNMTNDLFKTYVCIGTNVHYKWVVVHDSCFKNINLTEMQFNVTMLGDGKIKDMNKLNVYEVTDAFKSVYFNKAFDGLILFRLRFPIQLLGSVRIANVSRSPVSRASECFMLIWNLEKFSGKKSKLYPKIWKEVAYPSSKNDSKSRISVLTNSNLCKALHGSVLSCEYYKVQGVAGILTKKDCDDQNKHNISFVDLATFRTFFRDLIQDWEWTRDKIEEAGCAKTVGYMTLVLVLIFFNVFQ